MLLYPLEEQLDLPTTSIKVSARLRCDVEIVGQKDQRLPGFWVFQANVFHGPGVGLSRIKSRQGDFLVADQPNRLVDRPRTGPVELQGLFGSGYEECSSLVEGKQPLGIDLATVHDIERTRLGSKQIQDFDTVQQTVGNQHKCWDCAPQVKQRIDLDSGLRSSIIGPSEQRHTQAYGGGVEGIDGSLEIQPEVVFGIKPAGSSDQRLSEFGVDAAIPAVVCIGKIGMCDIPSYAHLVQLGRLGLQAARDVPQALSVGHLSKGHAQERVLAVNRPGVEIPAVLADQPPKCVPQGANSVSWAKTRFPVYIGFPHANPGIVAQFVDGVKVGDT